MLSDKRIVCVENQILATSPLQLNGIKEKTPIDSGSPIHEREMKDEEGEEELYDGDGEQIDVNSDEGVEQ